MPRISTIVSLTAFVGFLVLAAMLWIYLARHMPFRYFAWFCLFIGAYIAVEVLMRKSLAKRIQDSAYLKIMFELALGILFVTAFYFFAVYVYPTMR
jgi:hypothetical protein